ncbi:MAG: DUF4388 domain-containing protein [bacterium]
MVGFEINLKEFLLGDVLQFLARVKKSGVLKVGGGASGEIYIKEGLVIHATDGAEKGMEALLNLSFVDLETGSFETGTDAPETTISDDLGKLTENIEKRRIEFEQIKKNMPPMDTVYSKSTRDLESAVALRRTDWQILALVDGKRKLGDVITESKIGGYEAAKTITWLREQGLIFDPSEAERIMSKLSGFLGIVFEDFGKNGLNWMKQWAEDSAENKKVFNVFDINEETFKISVVGELTQSEIDQGIDNFLKYLEAKGPKLYGKVLFKKKWQGFKNKINAK